MIEFKNGKVAAFGEIMLRLSTNGEIASSKMFGACYGGTESNILAFLAELGHKTEYLTALPDTALGRAAARHLQGFGVGTSHIITRGDTLGLYFSGVGEGSRGSDIIYYRKNSEIAKLDAGAFDTDKVFDGVSLFHISGISFALSESSRRLAFELVRSAKARGIPVSFDFNYRSRLWSVDEARPILAEAARYADIVLAATIDLETFLGVTAQRFFDEYDGEYLIVRDRRVLSETEHAVRVAAYRRTGVRATSFETDELKFAVSERVGGGDAFDGGMLHGLLCGMDLRAASEYAMAAFVLKHGVKGDTFKGSDDDIVARRKIIFGE